MIDPPGGPLYLIPFVIAFLLGYLAGSIPFGLILTRAAGAGDVRKIGSGNIGATNVLRTGRKGLALATLIADLLKGGLPTLAAYLWLGPDIAVIVGLGTVVGHCFPVWLRFRGGKGVATAAGVVLALTPLAAPVLVAIFAVILRTTRFVSLASIIAAAAAPVTAWLLGAPQPAELYVALAIIIIAKHHENIARLIKGRENRFELSGKG
ncbi:MAG: glycerol-3-phosphate 1-O-acyltransferase PlsY [Geminicoccaceae bacterium]|nr:glycerol-3-phosphate 1-O-acyltransferase PlsY [Geminicoccaceae bacterium]